MPTNLIYDPPSGWRYGFPKPYRPLAGESLAQTLLRDGYPQSEIDNGGDRHVRFLGLREDLNNLEKLNDTPQGSSRGLSDEK